MHGTCLSASTGASLCLPSQLTFDYFRIKERSDNAGNDRPVGKGVRRISPHPPRGAEVRSQGPPIVDRWLKQQFKKQTKQTLLNQKF